MPSSSESSRDGWPIVAALCLVIFVVGAVHTGILPIPTGEIQDQQVRVTDCADTEKAVLDVGVADTLPARYVGLSTTESLEPNEGLLLVFDAEDTHRIEMRTMDFPLDIIFIDATGTITERATLPAPETTLEYYVFYESTTGTGQYILEAPAGWSDDHDIEAGDCVRGLP